MKTLLVITFLLALNTFATAADLVVPNKGSKNPTRGPSSATVQVGGAKAEALFRAVLAADDSLIDNCTAHTCSFVTKCTYDQTKPDKYVCTIVP